MEFKEPKLWAHQAEGSKRALKAGSYAFLFDPGCGKTLCTISTLRQLYGRNNRLMSTFIVAPLIVLENWKDEFAKFSRIPPERIIVLRGKLLKRLETLQKAIEKYNDQIIVITNYEGLVGNKLFFDGIRYWCPEVVVVDESQRIKSHNSKRTKLITELCDSATHKFLLTGTPILNSPLDIYAQYRALDGGESFGKNFFTFRNLYFYDKNAGMPSHVHFPNWVIREEAYKLMNEKIYSKAMRAKKEECLDLPPLVRQKIYVELPPQVRRLHEEMLNHFITVLDEDKIVTADIALTKTLRMLQIVNGFVKDEDGKESSIKSPKQDALKELLGDLCPGHKVLVWSAFTQNYGQIREVCNALKIKYVEAHGGVSAKEKFKAVYDFNNKEDISVFIGHPGALGIGINLVPASYSVYFSRGYNLEHDVQSEARNYRGGSEIHKKITRVDLIARDTIDEIVMEALERKMSQAEKILDLIKKRST